MPKVKSTHEATQTLTQMSATINNLLQELTQLGKTGDRLADPSVWTGGLAVEFQGIWSTAKTSNNKLITELQQLQKDVQTVATAILHAGGS
jgi:uncharacterized protein YukE